MKFLSLALVALLLASCGRNTDYYFYQPPRPVAEKVNMPVKIKELVSTGSFQVDVLWVIDNSGSMDSYQQSVITNASSFINNFILKPGLQWSMGIVSTDIKDMPYLGMMPGREFNNNSPNPRVLFNMAVGRLGILGDGFEKPLDSAWLNLNTYSNFARPGAVLALIFLTDAPDQSRNVNAKTFLSYLSQIKGGLNLVKVYTIIAPREYGCYTQEDSFFYKGSAYESMVLATGGGSYPICAPDYGKTLASIGNSIVSQVEKPRVYLKKRPDPASIRVFYKKKLLPPDIPGQKGYWIYNINDNAIIFTDLSFAPGGNEEVELDYAAEVVEP